MAFTAIDAGDVDFKSPIDENLMGLIRTNFDDHESRLGSIGGGGNVYQFKVTGELIQIVPYVGNNLQDSLSYDLDGTVISDPISFSKVRMALRKSGEPNFGDENETRIDIKAKTLVNHTILDIDYQMELATQSIGRISTALNTQSISAATADIAVQSVTFHKAQIAVNEIISLGNNYWQINLASAIDSDYKIGKRVKIASATNAGNNATDHIIADTNRDGGNNIVIHNTSGVEEFSSPATLDLALHSYNFINPVDSNFVVGESCVFSGMFYATHDGVQEIVAVNDGGNNIVAYGSLGAVEQGFVQGTGECLRHIYTVPSPVDPTVFVVGEKAYFSGHVSGNNDGYYEIVAINTGGNNITIAENIFAIDQAGVGGTIDTQRWAISFASSPASLIAVGDRVAGFGHTSSSNDQTTTVVEVERGSLSNIVVYSLTMTTQGSPAGTMRSEKMIVTFGSDLSANYTADRSFVTIKNTNSDFLGTKKYLPVTEVNRGGGANYNIVVKVDEALTESTSFAQNYPQGKVTSISKSLFSTKPFITSNGSTYTIGSDTYTNKCGSAFSGSSAVFYPDAVLADSLLSLELESIADSYEVFDLTVDLS